MGEHASYRQLLAAFGVEGRVVHVERLPGGHIHGTWALTVARGSEQRRYVAQSLNGSVFVDLPACESNLRRIDDHLHRAGHVPTIEVPRLARTATGSVQWCDEGGTTWRLAEFAEGTEAFVSARDAEQAYQAALAFGRYVSELADLPAGPLAPTIVRFHDPPWRLRQLDDAVVADPCGRRAGCADDIAAMTGAAGSILALVGDLSSLPMRAVHNDAKVANVRFDVVTGRASCVVDLDTTMPGSVAFDVGELLRSATTSVPEDGGRGAGRRGASATSVAIAPDRERVESVVRGFIDGMGAGLAATERAAFAYAGPLMAIENGVRMLTDHLLGDVYYGASRPGQNLDRARTQLAIAVALRDQCADIVADAARR